jgi:hypothetical protein
VKKIHYYFYVGLALAILIALAIRLPYFGQVPRGLNRDEAALGYNAFSLLKSGHDEYGRPWPVSITSFGDQKLPGYVYTLIPFIAVFDLSPVIVRLPSLLAGLVVIGGVGLLCLQLTQDRHFSLKHRALLSWLAMVLVAVSPWGNHMSRVAYEAHLAMALLVSGMCSYMAVFQTQKTKLQRWYLIATATLWSATLLTYHSYHIFLPLLLLLLLVIDRKKLLSLDRVGIGTGLAIGLLTVGLLISGGVLSANEQKSKGISPFNPSDLRAQAAGFRFYLPGDNAVYEKLVVNPLTEGPVRFAQNLVQVPAGNFLFVSGTGHGDHNPGNINNLHLFTAPLILIGLLWMWEHRLVLQAQRLVAWFAVAFVPSALTISPQHTIRFSPAFPILELLAAVGIWVIWRRARVKWQRWAVIIIGTYLILSSVTRLMIQYLYMIPQAFPSQEKYHLLAKTLIKYQPAGIPVVTQSPSSSPYIWYLFESKFDPNQVDHIIHYSADAEGFQHVQQVDNLYFETVNWEDLIERTKTSGAILVFKPSEIPSDKRIDPRMKLIDVITDSKSETVFEVWSLNEKNGMM